MAISFYGVKQAEGIIDQLADIREIIENKINLAQQTEGSKRILLQNNKIMRICFLVGLAGTEKRNMEEVRAILSSKTMQRIIDSFFTRNNLSPLYSALLKIRYAEENIDWTDTTILSKIIAYEMLRGRDFLKDEAHLNAFLYASNSRGTVTSDLPILKLIIGDYGDEIPAELDINSRQITNSQILVAGATGSGKTNLLAVLIQQIRAISTETAYPVNFLLFDYKGEFSDPANNHWLSHFEVDRSCILDPISSPLPFSPFKDFTGKGQNEINLYSTEMASALCALDNAKISANMNNRLSEAILDAYKETDGAPITFELMLEHYQQRSTSDKDDSVSSILKQLVRNNLFSETDRASLIDDCFIVKMDAFPKDGPIAKAIVYFLISKLNSIYEQLDKQAVSEECVQIRHFTIIDEAHYMLDFDNHPLRNLIAVGRNKGLSIILATQNMAQFQSKHFDFYANAQYPLIMKQQTISDSVIKDLFGVSGRELQEIRTAIAGLQKGELIIKDTNAFLLDLGKKFKKLKVTHLI